MFNKENKLTGKDVTILLLYLYFILSIIFIGVTIYDDIKLKYWESSFRNGQEAGYQSGVQAGYANAVSEIIVESRKCQAFPINIGEERVDLVNVACFQNEQAQEVAPSTEEIEESETENSEIESETPEQ